MVKDRTQELLAFRDKENTVGQPLFLQNPEKNQKSYSFNNRLHNITRLWGAIRDLQLVSTTVRLRSETDLAYRRQNGERRPLFLNGDSYIENALDLLQDLRDLDTATNYREEKSTQTTHHVAEKHVVQSHIRALYLRFHQSIIAFLDSLEDAGQTQFPRHKRDKRDAQNDALSKDDIQKLMSTPTRLLFDLDCPNIKENRSQSTSESRKIARPEKYASLQTISDMRSPAIPTQVKSMNMSYKLENQLGNAKLPSAERKPTNHSSSTHKTDTTNAKADDSQVDALKYLYAEVTRRVEQSSPVMDTIEQHVTESPDAPYKKAKPYKNKRWKRLLLCASSAFKIKRRNKL